MNRYDYIVVGSGIGGLYTALLAKEQGSVLVITKGSIDDCNTRYAQGGIAAAIGKGDSPELHLQDTINAGAGLSDEEAVRILVTEAPVRIADMVRYRVPFDTLDGEIALTMEAAHSVPRILHAGGDATGEHIELALSQQVRSSGIKVLENFLATEIRLEKGRVAGIQRPRLPHGHLSRSSRATTSSWPPAAPDSSLNTTPTPISPPATASLWLSTPARRLPTWSSSSSTPPPCACPACPRS